MYDIKRLTMGAVLVVLVFLAAEVALFVADPWLGRTFWEFEPDLGYRIRPGALHSNRFGFNDRDYPLERATNTWRILVVGDSFGWFGGRQGNYTEMLEERFAHAFGTGRVEVINAGYPATGTRHQRMTLLKYGLQYQPDLVVLSFYTGNDFFDADPSRVRVAVMGRLVDVEPPAFGAVAGRAVAPVSRLWLIARSTGSRLLNRWRVHEENLLDGEKAPGGVLATQLFDDLTWSHIRLCDVEEYHAGTWPGAEDAAVAEVLMMRDELARRGIAFMVALLPDEPQVDRQLFDRLVAKHGRQRDEFDLGFPQRLLRRPLDKAGIPYVDMLKRFRYEQFNGPLYLPNNTHWNRRGNEVAAKELFMALRAEAARHAGRPAP
jgi:hypothetical protein